MQLGLTEEQYWKLTEAKLFAMLKVKSAEIKKADFRSGIIQATIRAALGDKKASAFDAFPEHKSKIKPKKQSASETRALFKALQNERKALKGGNRG